jgi:hypothetical protein
MADPFIGTWELDPSTLRYESGRPGKRATYIIEASPAGLVFLLDGEDAEGRPIQFQYGGALDGTAQSLPGGLALILKRTGERSIESTLRRGEEVLDRWEREISPDGRTMRMTQFVRDSTGREFLNTSDYRRARSEND